MLKLMGLEYTIKYKKGKENLAADALLRRGLEEVSVKAISTAVPSWANEVSESYEGDLKVQQLITALTLQPTVHPNYSYKQGMLRYKGRLYIGSKGDLKEKLLKQMHDSPLGGTLVLIIPIKG